MFFAITMDRFIEGNAMIMDGDLCYQRKKLIEQSGDKVLRKLNPFFKEEEIFFQEYMKNN